MHQTSNAVGLSALRYLKAHAAGRGDLNLVAVYAESRKAWGRDSERIARHLKDIVSGTTTADLGPISDVAADLLLAVRPLSVVLRLPLRRVAPRKPMLTQATGSSAHWVAEGKARRLSAGTFVRDTGLRLKSLAAVTVVTNDALEDPSLDGEMELGRDLFGAVAQALDEAFLSVTNLGGDDAPASVTSTATPIASSGSTIDDLDADLKFAVEQLVAAGSNLLSAYWCMTSVQATRMSLMRGSSGAPAYPGLGALGGTLGGLPVLTSGSAASEANSDGSSDIALIDAAAIAYAQGDAQMRSSTDAMIEMSNAPTGDTITPAAATVMRVSMFDTESTALMAQVRANWKVRRPGSVQVITGVRLEPTT